MLCLGGTLCGKENDTMSISIIHTIELLCCRVCIVFYRMPEILVSLSRKQFCGESRCQIGGVFVCPSPLLSDDFIQLWYVKGPIGLRLGCGKSAAVARATELFSFF